MRLAHGNSRIQTVSRLPFRAKNPGFRQIVSAILECRLPRTFGNKAKKVYVVSHALRTANKKNNLHLYHYLLQYFR